MGNWNTGLTFKTGSKYVKISNFINVFVCQILKQKIV